MSELSNIVLWKHAKTTTFAIYVIALITAPFSQVISALALFSLCCFWSRCITLLNDYAKDLDVIDFFAVLIAINLGGPTAALFAFFNMIFPRLFGPIEPLNYTIKDSISMAGAALCTPFWYSITGQSLLITMYMFTVHRYAHYLILNLLFDQQAMGGSFIYMFIGVPTAYFMNTILVKVFGPAMEELFKKGIVVSKEILIFTTFVIAIMYAISYYKKIRTQEPKVIQEVEEESAYINIPEPWEVPLLMLRSSNKGLTMTNIEFTVGSTIIFFMFFVLRSFVIGSLPSLWEFLVILLFYAFTIIAIEQYIKWINRISRTSVLGIFQSLFIGVIVMLGVGFVV